MIKVGDSNHEHVDDIKNLIEKAHEHGVAGHYREHAETMSHKMNGSIRAREILQMMLDYPEREYPIVEIVDPKKKKQAAASKKDDDKKKKKKKRKEPPFPIPEWATELEQLVSQVNNM